MYFFYSKLQHLSTKKTNKNKYTGITINGKIDLYTTIANGKQLYRGKDKR